ncbi:MAG: hypothetical protein QOG80_1812 [Pseudonocardiales bacterium]|nr:hypothetical protein [Pseudonocardiales bacterium]
MTRNTTSRSLHDAGLAAWFGGTLANAVALNPAAAEAHKGRDRGAVVNAGWDRWTPVNAAAIAAHLVGGAGVLIANKGRVATQKGVGSMTVVKLGLTGAALAATGYGRLLGRRVAARPDVPVASGTKPSEATPPDVADAQKQLRVLQWAIPALTGAVLVMNSFAGEQQRASEGVRGAVERLTGH